MSFLSPALLFGAALVAVPVILHLVMRRRVQQLVFPALRFVQQRRRTNQTKLQLRHWLLLALRCAAIGLLAFALARPVSSGTGLAGGAETPAAVGLVFDVSPNMAYRELGETRLEAAQALGKWLVNQLPAEAALVVGDTAGHAATSAIDRDGATLRISRLATSASAGRLAKSLTDTFARLGQNAAVKREVFVFTDLASSAWSEREQAEVKQLLTQYPAASLYLVDVGARQPQNVGLTDLKLSATSLAAGEPLVVSAEVRAIGPRPTSPVRVELWLTEQVTEVKRGEMVVELPTEESKPETVQFTLAALPEGVHTGRLTLSTGDGLPIDDSRPFAVEVAPPTPVLLLSNEPSETVFLREAIAPTVGDALTSRRYECAELSYEQFDPQALSTAGVVALLDPPALEPGVWRALADFVSQGGQLAVFLGRRAELEAFNTAPPQALLPGPLKWISREATFLRPANYNAPALASLAEFAEALNWSQFPVQKHWEFAEFREGSAPIAAFADGDAALVERPLGRGRVLVMTTPISDPASHPEPWNLLATGEDPWPFVALANSMFDYLAGVSAKKLNFRAGETVVLPLPAGFTAGGVVLQTPAGDSQRQPLQPGQADVALAGLDEVGAYRVRAGGDESGLDTAFTLSCDEAVGDLNRLTPAELITGLGGERVRIARDPKELASQINVGRVGQEWYPYLMLALVGIIAGEWWTSNRFYKEH